MGNWYRAEQYADDILTALNNYVTGWTDWNIVLDVPGGPNWVGNFRESIRFLNILHCRLKTRSTVQLSVRKTRAFVPENAIEFSER